MSVMTSVCIQLKNEPMVFTTLVKLGSDYWSRLVLILRAINLVSYIVKQGEASKLHSFMSFSIGRVGFYGENDATSKLPRPKTSYTYEVDSILPSKGLADVSISKLKMEIG